MAEIKNVTEILVVEDDEDFLNLVTLNLEAKGISIDYAKSVDEAIKLLSEKTYKTLSLDVFLGEENCGKILQFLKQNPDNPNLEADTIICSSHANDNFISRMVTRGYKVFSKQKDLDDYFSYLGKLADKDIKDEFSKVLDEFLA